MSRSTECTAAADVDGVARGGPPLERATDERGRRPASEAHLSDEDPDPNQTVDPGLALEDNASWSCAATPATEKLLTALRISRPYSRRAPS